VGYSFAEILAVILGNKIFPMSYRKLGIYLHIPTKINLRTMYQFNWEPIINTEHTYVLIDI
jgi:hypothetical protein